MITIAIPDRPTFQLDYLVLDVNGTLTVDGALIPGVAERIDRLRERVTVQLLTADTLGRLAAIEPLLHVVGMRLADGNGADQKRRHVERLGGSRVAAIGNGVNDVGMLEAAALSVAVIGPEGAATAAVRASAVITTRITDALDLFLNPLRLVATLRG